MTYSVRATPSHSLSSTDYPYNFLIHIEFLTSAELGSFKQKHGFFFVSVTILSKGTYTYDTYSF